MTEALAFLFVAVNSSHAHTLGITYERAMKVDATVLQLMSNIVFNNGNRLLRRKVTDVAADFITTLNALRRRSGSLRMHESTIQSNGTISCLCGEILAHVAQQLPATAIICVATSCKLMVQELTEEGLVRMLTGSMQFMDF